MKIYIVEDDFFHLEDLKITLKDIEQEVVGNSDDPFQALLDIEKLQPDAVLIDIHLKGKATGIDLAKKIRDRSNIAILFTTSEKNEAKITEAAKVNPVAYLIKPIVEDDLRAALIMSKSTRNTASLLTEKGDKNTIYVKQGAKLVKIMLSDIIYAFVDTKNYCSIITKTTSKYTIRISISKLKTMLGTDNFIQTHRAFIVNKQSITSVNEADHSIQIGSHSIPIGRSYKRDVYKHLRIL